MWGGLLDPFIDRPSRSLLSLSFRGLLRILTSRVTKERDEVRDKEVTRSLIHSVHHRSLPISPPKAGALRARMRWGMGTIGVNKRP